MLDSAGNEASNSPKFAGGADVDLIDDLGNTDEGVSAAPAKKLKQKPQPHYLTGTSASRAMKRPKSPMANTTNANKDPYSRGKTGGPQAIPSSLSKRGPS